MRAWFGRAAQKPSSSLLDMLHSLLETQPEVVKPEVLEAAKLLLSGRTGKQAHSR